MSKKEIPYKIYLDESEMPKQWYNLRADMINKPAPLLNPATGKPVTLEELSGIFCEELAKQELDEKFCSSTKCIVRHRLYVLIIWKDI